MLLRYGVLGLAGEPTSGYDPARRVEEAQTVPPAGQAE
jgi:hypothetical protein